MMRRGRTAVALWLVAAALCGAWLARHLAVSADLGAFLPPAATPVQQVLMGQLRAGLASRLLLIGIEGADAPALAQASRGLAQALEESGAFDTVANGDPARLAKERERLFALRYVLSPGVRPERFTEAGLREALQEELELLASPFGALVRRTIAADPTGELRRIAAAWSGTATPAARLGVWFSADGSRALLAAQTGAPGFDLDGQAAAAAEVRARFAALGVPGARLLIAGPGLAAGAARAAIERDARRASLIAGLGVLLLLALVYRSAAPVLLSALPAASGMLAGVAAVSFLFGPVHGITLAFAAILIGEAVDYPTYLYAHAEPGEPLAGTARRIGPTLRLAVATSACGGLAMLLSSFRGLAQLGTLAMVGIATAGAVTLWVLPALTPASALRGRLPQLPLAGALSRLRGGRGTRIALFVLLAAALAVGLQRDRLWDDDLANLSPVPAELKALDAELRTQLGAPDLRHLVALRASDREAVLEKSERLVPLFERAVAEGWIGGYDMAARYVPSRRLQEARRAALPGAAALEERLARAQRGLPFRPGLFAPFAADVARARQAAPVEAGAWRGSALSLRLESLLAQDAEGWIAYVPLSAVRDAGALRRTLLEARDPAILPIDLKEEADALVAGYRLESLRLFALGFACIAALVFAGLRDAAATLRVLVPVLAGTLLAVALLLAAGARLTVVHLVALLFVVGVGLNYALFFDRRAPPGDDAARTRLSLALASATTLCSAASLAACATPVLRAIGMTVALGTLCTFALAALLARGPEAR